jgi:hypothetical protein
MSFYFILSICISFLILLNPLVASTSTHKQIITDDIIPTGAPTLQPTPKATSVYCPSDGHYLNGDMYLVIYNKTLSLTNIATCEVDPSCDHHTTACVGKVVCNGVTPGAQQCCIANLGMNDAENMRPDREKKNIDNPNNQYFLSDGTPCYFKKGQIKKSYFNVCESHCGLTRTPTMLEILPKRLRGASSTTTVTTTSSSMLQ